MQFHTLQFAVFFAVVYAAYLILPFRWQNWLLLGASYYFYCSWDWRFSFLLFAVTVLNFLGGALIASAPDEKTKKFRLFCCVFGNLAILGTFKYLGLLTGGSPWFSAVLPLGLSFYTFQMMSYPIDAGRGLLEPTRDFAGFALFGSFFPTIVAGPIERARNLLPQISAPRTVTAQKVSEGAWLIFYGLYKKILLADNLSRATAPVFASPSSRSGATMLAAVYLFAFQIYADFSGYSDMARGVARLMGFELSINFRTPFFSSNVSELWQRWHVSLTTWIKEYVFYPLALARPAGKVLSAALVTMITWTLFGLWHGASWKFVAWGLYHGALLVLYNRLRPFLNKSRISERFPRAWKILSAVFVFHLFAFGLLFFAAGSLGDAWTSMRVVFSGVPGSVNFSFIGFMALLAAPLFCIDFFIFKTDDEWAVFRLPAWGRGIVYFFMFYLIVFYGVFSAREYYYFRF